MKRIGLVVAVELEAFYRRYGSASAVLPCRGYDVLEYNIGSQKVYIAECGAGEIGAAAATQLLISKFDVDFILNFGVVGGLTDDFAVEHSCVVKSVVHYAYDVSQAETVEPGCYLEYPEPLIPTDESLRRFALEQNPALHEAVCASADKFVGDPVEKAELHTRYGADICDMESAGILLTCIRSHVPCLMLKLVSDGINGGAEEFFREFEKASDRCVDLLDAFIRALD